MSGSELSIPGLHAEATLIRDEWGIPHVRAGSARDAYFMQGYIQAADRFWQMDMARRQMHGRWSEWVGSAGIEVDKLSRRLGVAAASKRDWEAITDETRELVTAYSDGVNAWLAEGHVPYEYSLTDSTPEPWEPVHCIDVMRHRGFLMGSVWLKLWRAAATTVVGPEDLVRLRYDSGGDDELLLVPPGATDTRIMSDLAQLREAIADMSAIGGPSVVDGGSNNWAVSGSRTATGRPLVAGDPHRVFDIPGMYSQLHIACDEFDLIGLSIPGVPCFPHFGHNGSVAWGVTHAFVDQHDLFLERFQDGKYLVGDDWRDAQRRTETIQVRDGDPVEVEIVETHHGPVIVGETGDGPAIVLRSIQFCETDLSFDALFRQMRATTVDELYDATRGWGLIDHNLVAGDVHGNIGHLIRAISPDRDRINGWLPVPGWTGEYDWKGYVPFEKMPRVINPERGYIATANNRPISDHADIYVCTDCHPPHRARRVEARLEELPKATVEDMAAIHRDSVSIPATEFIGYLADVEPATDGGRRLKELITSWDGRMEPDSVAATAYATTRWWVARYVAQVSRLDATLTTSYAALPPTFPAITYVWWMVPTLLRDDYTNLTGGRPWREVLAEALDETGRDFQEQPWGQIHTAKFMHHLGFAFPEASALTPPGLGTGGDNECVWATASSDASFPQATSGAVARYVFDVGDWDNCQWVVVAGASGDPQSSQYRDQHEAWSKCELVPMIYSWDKLEGASDQVRLVPTQTS